MLKEFLNYVPEQIKVIEEAAKTGDADAIQKSAHSIKGAAGNLSANKVFSIALDIENKGGSQDISDISKLIEDLETEISRLKEFIANL